MKVSIILINFNDKVRVQRAIESAINQTYQNKEVILVDDGSDKETKKIYHKYAENLKVIHLHRNDPTDRTPSKARNAGIKEAKGDYICFLDSDNYYSHDFVNEMMKQPADVMMCNWDIIGKENYSVEIQKVWSFNDPLLQNYIRFQHLDHQCLLIKMEYFKKLDHFYDTRLPRSQDCDLICRLMQLGGKFQHLEKKLFVFEKHEDDQTKAHASIHGKTLWTLKNGLNPAWLFQMAKDNISMIFTVHQGIRDFLENDEWAEDRKKRGIEDIYSTICKKIGAETKE